VETKPKSTALTKRESGKREKAISPRGMEKTPPPERSQAALARVKTVKKKAEYVALWDWLMQHRVRTHKGKGDSHPLEAGAEGRGQKRVGNKQNSQVRNSSRKPEGVGGREIPDKFQK